MEKGKYMLIHKDAIIYRFKWLSQAKQYAIINCRGRYEFYVIVDTVEDKVVDRWNY